MTDLLSPASSRRTAGDPGPAGAVGGDRAVRRPPAVTAAAAGLAAPGIALLLLWTVGLVGWFAADGGSHGTTRSVLRVATNAWLLAHGADLTLTGAVVTATPLGLTLACGWLTYRMGRWAGRTSALEELRGVGLATVVLAGVYGVVALVAAVLASSPGASPGLGLAFLGGVLVGGAAGGAGLLRGTGTARLLRRAVPVPALAVLHGAAAVVLSMVALGALLTGVALAVRGSAAVGVVDGLDPDATGGVMMLLLLAGIVPNLALLADGYLLGPGFAVGSGTVVSPQEVSTGPVPSVPVLAALPENGWAPGWALAFLVVPVAVGAVAGFLTVRVHPTHRWSAGAWRALGAGALGSLLLALACGSAGGSIGPGRMADVGVGVGEVLLAALLAVTPAAALGGLLGTWFVRRRELPESEHPSPRERDAEPEPTVPVVLPVVLQAVPGHRRPAGDLSGEDTVALDLALDLGRSGTATPGPSDRRSLRRSWRAWLGDEG